MLSASDRDLLKAVADLDNLPLGAYSLRKNARVLSSSSTDKVHIEKNENEDGITVTIEPGTTGEFVHVPVILDEGGLHDVVHNTFVVGEDSDVTVIAGCGIQCGGSKPEGHEGTHEIRVKKGARLKYVEKHYAGGSGAGKRTMNPTTRIFVDDNARLEMELTQIGGIDETNRLSESFLGSGSSLLITERVMTTGDQKAASRNEIELAGENSRANMISRSVIKGRSRQNFYATIIAKAKCVGHIECDAIIMEEGTNETIPSLRAEHPDAELSHEASIGKIAGDQLTKLMSMGVTYEDAVNMIIRGFLR